MGSRTLATRAKTLGSSAFTQASFGAEENPPILVYDTSGPFSDPAVEVDLLKGMPDVRDTRFVKQAAETFYLADTNQDGVLSREELRIAVASYGINLSQQQSAAVTAAADTDMSGAIDFGEFLDFVGPTGSPGKAIKNSLLGF